MKYDIIDNFKRTEKIQSELRFGDFNKVKDPFFSVVIPTYRRPDLLKETIMSAANQDNFDFPYEIIVVDNEATDTINETELLIRDLDIENVYYYKNKKNLGGAGNWNRGIFLARSNWIIMCHDDDWIKKDCLAVMKEIIEQHVNTKMEIGYIRSSADSWYDSNINCFQKSRKHMKLPKKKTALIKQTYNNVIWGGGATWAGAPTCGTLLNKSAVLEVGGYNQDLTPCFDCYVPYHMLGRYAVYKTVYSLGVYRWSQNDTYRKETLLGLIKAYNEFLEILSNKHYIIRFFSNEHFVDCVNYYRKKANEVNIEISDEDIMQIRDVRYSKLRLKILYLCRKINYGLKILLAK